MYRRSGGSQLLPAFGYNLLQLAYLLAPLDELFHKTLYCEDARLAERFRQHLAIARLPEAQARRLPEFSLQTMRQRALASASPIKELAALDQEFEQLLAAFSAPEFYSFDLDFTATDRLASLCRHDLGALFKLFDPGFDPALKGRKPDFQPVPAKKALKELLDLYFILAGIQLSDGVESNLFALLDRLGEARRARSRRRRHTSAPVRPASACAPCCPAWASSCGQELAPELLATLIRVIQEDPGANPRVVSEEMACLQTIKSDLAAAFRKDRERLQREINENTIGGDLKTLFAGAEPLEVTGYNQALARELSLQELRQLRPGEAAGHPQELHPGALREEPARAAQAPADRGDLRGQVHRAALQQHLLRLRGSLRPAAAAGGVPAARPAGRPKSSPSSCRCTTRASPWLPWWPRPWRASSRTCAGWWRRAAAISTT